MSRGRRVRQKNARKPLCANCSKENIFNLFNKPPNNFWKYSAAVKLQFWVGHYLLSLYLFNIVWKTQFSSLGGGYVVYEAIILTRLFLFFVLIYIWILPSRLQSRHGSYFWLQLIMITYLLLISWNISLHSNSIVSWHLACPGTSRSSLVSSLPFK